jgi:hypothetical protein
LPSPAAATDSAEYQRRTDSPLNREAELLILCASPSPGPEREARIRALVESGLDWPRAVHLSLMQSVMPLLYRLLNSRLSGSIAANAAEDLRREFYGHSLRSLHLARELARISSRLESGGVEPIAVKGPALAMAAYGDVTMRQFSDLDLLVRPGEMPRAAEILSGEGYRPRAGYDVADRERPGMFEIAMVRDGLIGEIDLHWRLVPPYLPFALDGEFLWERAVRVTIAGASVRTLDPADHLLYLCAHGAKHGWEALSGISDLAGLMCASERAAAGGVGPACEPIDWNYLRARAMRAGAVRPLALGVLLAHELFEAQAPAEILGLAHADTALRRAARVFIDYVKNPGEGGPGFYQRWIVPLSVVEGPLAKLRYAAARALLPSPDDREFLRLPATLSPFYFLLRPLRVALKEGSAVWRRGAHPAARPADH